MGPLRDAHRGPGERQVSLLANESIAKQRETTRAAGAESKVTIEPGVFAENITTEDIDVVGLGVGARLAVGANAVLEITRIGKECHDRCAIYEQTGDCIMPREGVFARVLSGGDIAVGDAIRAIDL